ncbi:MAG: hypothetical protein IJ415_03245 [Clostridia bacterium]|nr:hypothetical protein [Clostridia bacterium]
MKQFHNASLVHFQSKCKEHMDAAKAITNYPFYIDLSLIKEFLENTDFPGGVDIDENDYKKYVVEGTFMVGIDIINDELDEYKYLFDAFNVYYCQEGSLYYTQDPTLTQAWRKTMKNYYHNTSYSKDAKKLIQNEMQEKINEVVDDYNKQQNDLL